MTNPSCSYALKMIIYIYIYIEEELHGCTRSTPTKAGDFWFTTALYFKKQYCRLSVHLGTLFYCAYVDMKTSRLPCLDLQVTFFLSSSVEEVINFFFCFSSVTTHTHTHIYLHVYQSQKFCNILVAWGTVQQLRMLLPRSWRWWTTLVCEMLRSPVTI